MTKTTFSTPSKGLLKGSKGMTFRPPAVHAVREFVVRRQRSLPFGLGDRPHGVEHEFRVLLRVFAVEDSASAHNNIRPAGGGRADVLAGDAAVEGDQLPKPQRLDSRLEGLDPPPSGGNKLLPFPSWSLPLLWSLRLCGECFPNLRSLKRTVELRL